MKKVDKCSSAGTTSEQRTEADNMHVCQPIVKPNVVCSCGGGNGAYHPVGVGGCFRYHVTDENEIPKNRRRWYNPEWWEEPVWIWDIGDHWVTEYTLFNQRLYAQDENGNWTRPKSKDSVNSLEGD